jgi:hypothetical protein
MLIPFGGGVDDALPRCPDCLEQLVDPILPTIGAAFLHCARCGRDWRPEDLLE